MLTAYKHSTNNDIVETTLDHSASWINVVEPDREEIERITYLKILSEIH